jgi:hypothetical protein
MALRGGYGLTYFPQNLGSMGQMKNQPFYGAYSQTSLANTGGVPNVFMRNGFPLSEVSYVVPTPREVSGSFVGMDPEFRDVRFHQFNVQLEKEFAGNVIAAGYVGQRSQLDSQTPQINLAPAGPGPVQARRLLAQTFPNLTDVSYRMSQFESKYDAAQFIFRRRLQAGLSLTAHYTRAWARNEGTLPWMALDPATLEPTSEWSENANSRPHATVLQVNYMLPWGNEMTGVSRALLGGWQVNASAFWQAGRAYNVTNATERGNTGGSDRPNMIGDPILPKGDRTVDRWFNTDAFQVQPQFTFGNAPNFIDYGPPQRRLDLSFFKEFGMGGARRLQFRYEVYNVFNAANFNSPNTALGNTNFGTISSTGLNIPRQMQFALKYLF